MAVRSRSRAHFSKGLSDLAPSTGAMLGAPMWLIRTKLEAPEPTDRLIARPRLRRHIPAVLGNRLTLVHAPAGFGKTSLLAEWRRCFRARKVRTAWLSLDQDDSEPRRFLAYLTASLNLAGVDLGHLAPPAAHGLPNVPISSLIAAVKSSVGRSSARIVVLIDDYHRLQGQSVADVLEKLVMGLHASVSFVISSREWPSHFAQRMVLADACLELSADDLRFTADEAHELLRQGVRTIAEEDHEAVIVRADGWAIALTAARDWLASGGSVTRARQSPGSATTDLSFFIANQVLIGLTASERDFLYRTAIVDRFTVDLAAQLCERLPVRQIITALERKDLLVVVSDGACQWFRFHRPIAETAMAAVEREQPLLVAALHRRAAEWFLRYGLRAEAVRHAVATGDDNLLARHFEQADGWKLVANGHIDLARDALTHIAPEVLRAHPRTHLASILILAKQGCHEEARRQLDVLAATQANRADALLSTEIDLFVLGLQGYAGATAIEEQRAALLSLSCAVPDNQTASRAILAGVSCNIHYECGDLELAIVKSGEALRIYRAARSLVGEVWMYVQHSAVLLELGRLRDAQAVLREALLLARDTTGLRSEVEAAVAVMLGSTEYESGNLAEAERLIAPALAVIEQRESWFEVLSCAYLTTCALARDREGSSAALAIVHRARRAAIARSVPRLASLSNVMEMRERVLAGETDGPALLQLEASIVASRELEHSPRLRMRAGLELARLAIARGEYSAAETSASDIAVAAEELRHQRVRIEALIVRALAQRALGQCENAVDTVESAVELAMHEGYRQVFCDFGSALLPLLNLEGTIGPDGKLARVRDRFLSPVIDATRAKRRGTAPNPDLSGREQMVLRLLAEGLSNKAIAKSMQVSGNTVKFHLKNIYAKLGIASRADAVTAMDVRAKR